MKELSESLVRSLLDSAPDATIIVDETGRIIYANSQVTQIFGYRPDEITGRPIETMLPERFRAAHPAYRHAFLVDATTRPMGVGLELYGLHRDGHEIPVEISLSPVHTEEGMLVSSSIRDATSMREMQKSLTGILEQSLNEIYVCDANSLQFIHVNRGALENLGYTMEEMRHLTPLQLKPEFNQETYNELIAPLRSGAKDKVEFITVHRRKNGLEYPVEVHLQQSIFGVTPVFVAIILDITDRKLAERKLLDADKRKDEFLAVLAHELRNPLAPIFSSLEIMNLSDDENTVKSAKETIERQVRNLRRLVNDLVDVSRIDHGKLEMQMSDIELAEVLESAIEVSKPLVDARNHELTVELTDEPITIYGDATRLAQVFGNLLTNAAKYTGENGHVRLVARASDSEIHVSVEDDGPGIAANQIGQIFEMFRQIKQGPGLHSSGLGVGLPLAKWLVEKHQGTIDARSEGPGKGSVFTVRLPRSRRREPVAVDSNTQDVPAKSLAHRVLIVDDNDDAADAIFKIVELLGHLPKIASNGRQAIDYAEQYLPHLIFLDIGLPDLNGYEVARNLRSQSWGKSIRITALTGFGQDKDLEHSREAGIDQHIVKPIDISTVRSELDAIAAPSQR
jgi:PAS domain S-box-containing protein